MTRSQVAFVRVPTIAAVAAMALLSTSCAVLFSGTTQTVPVTISAGAVAMLAANDFFVHALPDLQPVAWGLVATTFTPLLVDFGTGAMYQLTPGEVVVVFDGP